MMGRAWVWLFIGVGGIAACSSKNETEGTGGSKATSDHAGVTSSSATSSGAAPASCSDQGVACAPCCKGLHDKGAAAYNTMVECVFCSECRSDCAAEAHGSCPVNTHGDGKCDHKNRCQDSDDDATNDCSACALAENAFCSQELQDCQDDDDCVAYSDCIAVCP